MGSDDSTLGFARPREVTAEELDQQAGEHAARMLSAIPKESRSYFYFRNDDEVELAFKRNFLMFAKDRVVVTPSRDGSTHGNEKPAPR